MKVTNVGNNKNTAFIEVNGKKIQADLVIGADGIHSKVSDSLFGKKEIIYTGNVAWRMLIPVEELPENLILPDTTVWLGPNKHFVTYHVNGGKSINCVCLVEQDGWLNESWSEKGEIGELKKEPTKVGIEQLKLYCSMLIQILYINGLFTIVSQ